MDTDIAVEKGQACWIQYTPMYVAPETMRAEANGQTTIVPETSIDMWAFGILGYEVLTGSAFFHSIDFDYNNGVPCFQAIGSMAFLQPRTQ